MGASDAKIYGFYLVLIPVYDIEYKKTLVEQDAHDDDINSVCFAEADSPHILLSGSDDTFIKLWDRRAMKSSRKAVGNLVGHIEGITCVSTKGDGRFCISNSKVYLLAYKLGSNSEIMGSEEIDF